MSSSNNMQPTTDECDLAFPATRLQKRAQKVLEQMNGRKQFEKKLNSAISLFLTDTVQVSTLEDSEKSKAKTNCVLKLFKNLDELAIEFVNVEFADESVESLILKMKNELMSVFLDNPIASTLSVKLPETQHKLQPEVKTDESSESEINEVDS
jgi:hypothetical protein